MNSPNQAMLLQRQIDQSKILESKERYGPEFKKWERDTEITIQRTFGTEGRHITDFKDISYSLGFSTSNTQEQEYDYAYKRGLETARQILTSMIEELRDYGDPSDNKAPAKPGSIALAVILDRFHLVVRQMRLRHNSRPSLDVNDEYDVQDLMHSVLHLVSDDIREEECTPSYAGGAARVDFLLKKEQTVVEVKKTRNGLSSREVGEELIIDIARYQAHPDCKRLICFVYDPEERLKNPTALENDLSKKHGELEVVVVIRPKRR